MKSFDASEFKTSKDSSDLIGNGSYASVRKCYHKELRTVAIKYFSLSGSSLGIQTQSDNIENEAEVLYRLQHKNIIRMFGITKWDNNFGIVMEEGKENLEDVIIYKTEKSVSWPLRLQFCSEIAGGLSYLHYHNPKRAFVHGDLKLQNVLLTKNLVVKIADFGAVSLLQATGFSAGSLCFASNRQHTLLYAAPEFLNNPDMKRTRAMDVYSYAMVVYEIITRSQAFLSSRQVGLSMILEMIKSNGQKPNVKLIDDIRAKLKHRWDIEICNELKTTTTNCWKTNPRNRPTFKHIRYQLQNLSERVRLHLQGDSHLVKRHVYNIHNQVPLNQIDLSTQSQPRLLETRKKHTDAPKMLSSDSQRIQRWYFGDIDRNTANNILTSSQNGDSSFLVRETKYKDFKYVLSANKDGKMLHYGISQTNLENTSLLQIVDTYQKKLNLKKPCSRNEGLQQVEPSTETRKQEPCQTFEKKKIRAT